jgi:hypothetical protein
MYSTLPVLLKSSVARSIGSELNTSSGWICLSLAIESLLTLVFQALWFLTETFRQQSL